MPARSPYYKIFSWVAVAAYMGLIFYLSHQPSLPLPMRFAHQDKVIHFIAYFIMAFLLAHAWIEGGMKKRFLVAFLLASFYGITDEFHQSFIPGRDATVWDWLADSIGAWFGAFTYLRGEKWRSLRLHSR